MKQTTLLASDAALVRPRNQMSFCFQSAPIPGFDGNEGPVCADLLVMIRRHFGDALILVASFTGGSILMFGP